MALRSRFVLLGALLFFPATPRASTAADPPRMAFEGRVTPSERSNFLAEVIVPLPPVTRQRLSGSFTSDPTRKSESLGEIAGLRSVPAAPALCRSPSVLKANAFRRLRLSSARALRRLHE
jgi:hypothetical protein